MVVGRGYIHKQTDAECCSHKHATRARHVHFTMCCSPSDARNIHVSDVAGPGCVSSLDLLSASGLVNYFGKWTDLMQVEISPLLMQKGVTRLALYGLSHLKDERLARLFRDHHVSVIVPRLFSMVT
jgi:hypothetical protein